MERVAVLCRFLDIGSVTKSHLLKYSLAHAFCCFLASIEDVNPAVATRARLLLDTIKRPSLQVNEHHRKPMVISHQLRRLTCLRLSSSRVCVCVWIFSLIRWSEIGPSSWENCCCFIHSNMRFLLSAGSSSSIDSRRSRWRLNSISTAIKTFLFLQVSVRPCFSVFVCVCVKPETSYIVYISQMDYKSK